MAEAPDRARWPREIGGWAAAVALGAVGVLMVHHPMLLSGLEAIQTDRGDSRLILYLLEHTYLWAGQAPPHRDLWSPPFFFPASNIGAYSDLLLTIAPPYWALRLAGLEPDSAFQGWMIAVSALNYGAALAFLRRACRFARPGALAGAFLMAFAAPRTNLLSHQQIMPLFFVIGTLFALARLLDEPRPGRVARWAWWQVAVWGVVAQLYAAFYVGWFLILGLGVATAWGLALPSTRGRVLGMVGRDAPALAAALAAGGLALVPFFAHYLAAARELGPREFSYVRLSILLPWSWWDVGSGHWLGGWTAGWSGFGGPQLREERRVGTGLVTPVACAAGWWLGRGRPLIRLAAPVALTLMVVATFLPGDAIANLGLVLALLIAARACSDRGRPGFAWPALILLGVATAARFPSWRMIGLILFLIGLGLVEAGRARREPARRAVMLLMVLWLSLRLFDPLVMGIALGLVGLAVLAVAILFRPADRALVLLVGLAIALLLVGAITYPDRAELGAFLVLVPVALGLVPALPWGRVGDRPPVVALGVALGAILLLEGQDTLWYLVHRHVPGGNTIRGVGRIGLAVLVPAALGLAALFASPWAARRPIRAGLIALICLAEQGVTTPSFSKSAERRRSDELARLVDPAAPAFYYRPAIGDTPYYQVDAMLMSLRTGVPTVNGYSGNWPPKWFPLMRVDWYKFMPNPPVNPQTPREAVAEWLRASGTTADRVQVIER